jgi:hypothetical protein
MASRIVVALALADLLMVGAYRSDSSEGNSKMVCCLLGVGKNFRVRTINPQQGEATGKVSIKKQCKLVALAPRDCENDSDKCEHECEDRVRAHPQYLEMLKDEARADYIHVKNVEAPQEKENATKSMRHKIAVAKMTLKGAKHNASHANLAWEKTKAALEVVQEQLRLAQEEFDSVSQELVNQTEITEKTVLDAEIAYNQTLSEIDSRLDAAAAKWKSFANSKRQRVAVAPQRCADSKYCCCSIGHVAVRVKTEQFTDWAACKNPQPYTKSKKLFAGKARSCSGVMAPCARCAYKVCDDKGYGVCP